MWRSLLTKHNHAMGGELNLVACRAKGCDALLHELLLA